MKYINDEQIINDAAQMLIQKHLAWSGSDTECPSRDLDNVRGLVFQAYLKANFTPEEWNEKSEESKNLANAKVSVIYREARQLADRKWQAAMLLLGMSE